MHVFPTGRRSGNPTSPGVGQRTPSSFPNRRTLSNRGVAGSELHDSLVAQCLGVATRGAGAGCRALAASGLDPAPGRRASAGFNGRALPGAARPQRDLMDVLSRVLHAKPKLSDTVVVPP